MRSTQRITRSQTRRTQPESRQTIIEDSSSLTRSPVVLPATIEQSESDSEDYHSESGSSTSSEEFEDAMNDLRADANENADGAIAGRQSADRESSDDDRQRHPDVALLHARIEQLEARLAQNQLRTAANEREISHDPIFGSTTNETRDRNSVAPAHREFVQRLQPTTPPIMPRRRDDAKVPDPPEFDGTKYDEARTFLAHCQNAIDNAPYKYSNDKRKIALASSRLTKSAAQWYMRERMDNSLTTTDWIEFGTQFLHTFGRQEPVKHAVEQLQRISQGNRSVQAYLLNFQEYSVVARLGDASDIMLFRQGLNADVRQRLDNQLVDEPTDFKKFSNYCIKAGEKVWEAKKSRQNDHAPRSSDSSSKAPRRSTNNSRPSNRPTQRTYTSNKPTNTSSLPRLAISSAEYQRRIDKRLCANCAYPGHLRRDCTFPTNTQENAGPKPRVNFVDTRSRLITYPKTTNTDRQSIVASSEKPNAPASSGSLTSRAAL